MGRRSLGAMVAALALLGGCARQAPPQDLAAAPRAARTPAVACTTTWLVLATVSRCGADGFKLGVVTE